MIIELVYYLGFWLNCVFTCAASQILWQQAIFAGINIENAFHCMLNLGTYKNVHEDNSNYIAS